MEINTYLPTQKNHNGFILIICIYFLDVQYNAICDSYNCVENGSCTDLDNFRSSGTLTPRPNNVCPHLAGSDEVNQCEPLSWANTCFVVYRFETCTNIYTLQCFDDLCIKTYFNLNHGVILRWNSEWNLDPYYYGVFYIREQVHVSKGKVYYEMCYRGKIICGKKFRVQCL